MDLPQVLTPKIAPRKLISKNRQQDSLLFDGSCYIKKSGLSLSSRGFSMEVQVKVSASASSMDIIKEVNEDKFRVWITPSTWEIGL